MPWEGAGEWGLGQGGEAGAPGAHGGRWGGSHRGGGLKKGTAPDRGTEEVEESVWGGKAWVGFGGEVVWSRKKTRRKQGPVRLLGFPVEE